MVSGPQDKAVEFSAIFVNLGFLRLIEGCPPRVSWSFVSLVPYLSCIEGCPLHVHLGFRCSLILEVLAVHACLEPTAWDRVLVYWMHLCYR